MLCVANAEQRGYGAGLAFESMGHQVPSQAGNVSSVIVLCTLYMYITSGSARGVAPHKHAQSCNAQSLRLSTHLTKHKDLLSTDTYPTVGRATVNCGEAYRLTTNDTFHYLHY
jgi:hypothetical protein